MRDVEGGDLSRRIPVETVDEMGRLSQGFNRMLGRLSQADAQIRAFNQRLGRRDRGGDARPVGEERDAGAAEPAAQRHAPRQRVEGAAGDAGPAGRPARARDRHAAVVGVGARAAGAAQRELPPALRERLDVLGARDRAHQQDRARLPRFDAAARARAPADRPAPPARGGGGARAGRRRRPRARRSAWKVASELGDVVTDPGLLRQIVVNLLSNALDAVDRNGRVDRRGAPGRRRRYPHHRERHRPRHRARRPAAHLRAVLHDQGPRQGHRPRPGHLPPADRGAGRHHLRRERAGQGLDVLRPAAARRARRSPSRGRARRERGR